MTIQIRGIKVTLVLSLIVILGLSSCKTTERNYKAAYDTAMAKKAKETVDNDLPDDMVSADAPKHRVIGKDTIQWKAMRLIPDIRPQVSGEDGTDGQYFVAVGKYRMPTNARSGAERMRGNGYPGATAAKAADDEWYLISGRYQTLENAAKAVGKYIKDNKDYPYPGLYGKPLVIIGE